ncbi:MAG: hypothetical protein M1823_003953 [Watsoniomyces obsoletus]|nr:MAG: hypothetical protein M1823_003953 [Watsoniomyces obsoletus]
MGQARQRKKNKSSINKVRPHRKPVRKVPVDAALAARWNHKETLSQNYRRLGLTARLKAPSGGVEKKVSDAAQTSGRKPGDTLAITPSTVTRPTALAPSEVGVERDSKGAIVRIIRDSTATQPKTNNPLNDPLNELSSDEEELKDSGSAPPRQEPNGSRAGEGGDLIQELEAAARRGEGPRRRKRLSEREVEWIVDLVDVYGNDYHKMFWDRKRNPLQLTVNDIRRRVERWKKEREEEEARGGEDTRIIREENISAGASP